MGHCIHYFDVKNKSEVLKICDEFSKRNCDRLENPNGHYLKRQMHFSDIIFDGYDDAIKYIEKESKGKFYYDLATRYRTKSDSGRNCIRWAFKAEVHC